MLSGALASGFLGCQRTQGDSAVAASPHEVKGGLSDGGVSTSPTVAETALTSDETATGKLVAFQSEDDLKKFFGTWKEGMVVQRHAQPTYMNGPSMEGGAPPPTNAASAVPKPPSPSPASPPAQHAPARARAADSVAPAKKGAERVDHQ